MTPERLLELNTIRIDEGKMDVAVLNTYSDCVEEVLLSGAIGNRAPGVFRVDPCSEADLEHYQLWTVSKREGKQVWLGAHLEQFTPIYS